MPLPEEAVDPDAARAQARRRLIGAGVLLAIGVVAFPVIFETQPRPLPTDIPIQTPGNQWSTPPAAPAPRVSGTVESTPSPAAAPAAAGVAALPTPALTSPATTSATGDAAAPLKSPASDLKVAERAASAAQAAPVSGSRSVETPAPPAADKLAEKAADRVALKPDAKPVTVAKAVERPASAAKAPEKSASAPKPAEGGRFIVQAGAYTEAVKLKEARARIEKLGLKTYTQVLETPGSAPKTRVRVGPYATKAEADAAAVKLQKAGLPAAVLTL